MFIYEINDTMTIRMLKANEAEHLFSIIEQSRTSLRKWLPWVDDTKTSKDSLNFILHSFELYANRHGLNAGIFYHDELIGMVSLNQFDWTNRIGYIGYWLSEDFQGKGIMTHAVQALIDEAFNHFELNKVEIRAAIRNEKSRAIPERLNFKKEGVLRQVEWLYDHYVDHAVYGLLKNEWKK